MKYMQIFCLLAFLTSGVMGEPVARVDKLHGAKKLEVQKANTSKWYRAHLEQDANIKDLFRTDPDSLASIMFFLGGKASMGKNSKIQIISEKGINVLGPGVELQEGVFWARFNLKNKPDGNQPAPIQVKTAGGVMGIRGTEFVVQIDENGFTKLSLLDGDVDINPDEGEAFQAKPGNEVTFGPNTPLLHQALAVADLRANLKRDLGPAYEELQNALNELTSRIRELKLEKREAAIYSSTDGLTARYYELVGDTASRNAAVDVKKSRDEHTALSESANDLEAMLKRLENKGKTQEPERVLTTNSHPTLNWDIDKADRYAVVLLDLEDDDIVHWVDETPDTRYAHPQDAEPLQPGLYRYRIIPMSEEGEVSGVALEGQFRVDGVSQLQDLWFVAEATQP
jgi:uncharacterized cupin superfamily protein